MNTKECKPESPIVRNELIVVGTGIRIAGQITSESIAHIKNADLVLHLVGDPVAEEAIRLLNPDRSRSLVDYYSDGKPRITTYEEIVEAILSTLNRGRTTCVVAYGHPGVFAFPTHEAIRRARDIGFTAIMLPAISAEDCLYADLGIDPARHGCQSYEATDYLLRRRHPDLSACTLFWQLGCVGDNSYRERGYDPAPLALFVDKLLQVFPESHPCILYEASFIPGLPPTVVHSTVAKLSIQKITPNMTLYLPPLASPEIDHAMASRLAKLKNYAI